MLLTLHVLFAVLASFRLVDMLLRDRIAKPVRERLGKYYLFGCVKCLSVWAGMFATASLVWLPWLNWPLALSWLYILSVETRGHYLSPTIQQVPYVPKRTPEKMLQDTIGELAIHGMQLQLRVDEARAQLSRLTG